MGKQLPKLSAKKLRANLVRMGDEQVLFVARGAIDELVARNVIGCSVAVRIIEALSPENVRVRST
jgi:hypothetical protein